jgi:dTDP-4-amino-4,6-dideoxygalactose transaminase
VIRVFEPSLGDAELAAVGGVFSDRWPGKGRRVELFEQAFADYVSADRETLIAVTSCTEGLFQAIAALEPDPTSEIILPTVSFIGAAHAVRGAGATVALVDVDSDTLNPRVDAIERAITPRTTAILLLHFGGCLDWIEDIAELAKARGLVLIEDSACSLGGRRKGIAYGCFGDIGVWSFDAMKLLVTGDGGMIRVGDEELRRKISAGVNLGGVGSGLNALAVASDRWWEFDAVSWGRHAFMNDIAASIGLVQLGRIERFVARRRQIADYYDKALAPLTWLRPRPVSADGGVPYFYWVRTAPGVRNRLATYLHQRGVYTTFRYWPLHRTSLYRDHSSFPGADLAADSTLLLPVHQNLSQTDVNHIIDAITAFTP